MQTKCKKNFLTADYNKMLWFHAFKNNSFPWATIHKLMNYSLPPLPPGILSLATCSSFMPQIALRTQKWTIRNYVATPSHHLWPDTLRKILYRKTDFTINTYHCYYDSTWKLFYVQFESKVLPPKSQAGTNNLYLFITW